MSKRYFITVDGQQTELPDKEAVQQAFDETIKEGNWEKEVLATESRVIASATHGVQVKKVQTRRRKKTVKA